MLVVATLTSPSLASAGLFRFSFVDPQDEGDMFLRNVS
jgi:hypothetical protein